MCAELLGRLLGALIQVLPLLCATASSHAGSLLRGARHARLSGRKVPDQQQPAYHPHHVSLALSISHLKSECVPEVPSNSEFSNPVGVSCPVF